MSFNLNDNEFGSGVAIFNNGNAGKVKNVEINVEKKDSSDTSNKPDYSLIVKDNAGSVINQGFYYFTPNPGKNEEENKNYERYLVSRVLSIANAVMPKDYKYPEVNSSKEALDVLFKIIKENCEGKKFNVFTNYGTKTRPSKYLQLRFFNFIENSDTNELDSKLSTNVGDMLERISMDAEPDKEEATTSASW